MPLVAFFVSATKLAGILVTVTVAANAISFNRFRRKNLMPIPSVIDESSDILAVFNLDDSEAGSSTFLSTLYLVCLVELFRLK